MGSAMEMGSGMMGPGMGEAAEAVDPAENRYVNNEYEPIAAADLRSAMASSSSENAFLNVAKRLPVKLTVKMDQRKLPQLLTACGNARLMVEVRQVRINVKGGPKGGSAGGMGMEGLGIPSPASSGFGELGSGMEMGGMGSGRIGQAEDYPFDLPIDVYGVIYIYNPPDLEKLGVEEVTAETVIQDQSIGEAPVPATDSDPQPVNPPAQETVQDAGEPPVPAVPAPPADGQAPADPAGADVPAAPAAPVEVPAPAVANPAPAAGNPAAPAAP